MYIQGVPHHIGTLLALIYDFRERLRKMNHFKKLYKAIVKYFLQKILGFSNRMCVFFSLKRRDNPIWYGTLCIYIYLFMYNLSIYLTDCDAKRILWWNTIWLKNIFILLKNKTFFWYNPTYWKKIYWKGLLAYFQVNLHACIERAAINLSLHKQTADCSWRRKKYSWR